MNSKIYEKQEILVEHLWSRYLCECLSVCLSLSHSLSLSLSLSLSQWFKSGFENLVVSFQALLVLNDKLISDLGWISFAFNHPSSGWAVISEKSFV